jgi:hypothetical protein
MHEGGGIADAPVPHIDVHMHLVGGQPKAYGEAVESCAAAMEQHRITRAVVMGPPQPPPGNVDAPDFLPELRRYGGRFAFLAGGGTLNPMVQMYRDPRSVTPDIRQDFVDTANRLLDQGALGFGEIAVLHLSLLNTHPFEQVPSTHPLLAALAEVADRRKVVIDLHLDPVTAVPSMRTPPGLQVPPNPPTLDGNIAGFERLLSEHPDARIVWAHGGSDFTGNMTPALIGRLMDGHFNLFMSLRPVPPQVNSANPFGLRFHNLILTQAGIEPGWHTLLQKHSDRFVMGSDSFFVASSANPEGAPAMLARGNQARARRRRHNAGKAAARSFKADCNAQPGAHLRVLSADFSRLPSEDANRASLDVSPVAIDDAIAGRVADFHSRDGVLECRKRAHEVIEAEFAARGLIDEHVDIGIFPGLIARRGAEKKQCRYAVRPQLGLGGLELGDDLGSVHCPQDTCGGHPDGQPPRFLQLTSADPPPWRSPACRRLLPAGRPSGRRKGRCRRWSARRP